MGDQTSRPYLPEHSKKAMLLLLKAAEHNASFDAIERQQGQVELSLHPPSIILRTAVDAIACGIQIDGWDEVAQGLALVIQAEYMVRQLESHWREIKIR